ncbi:MAG: Lhr family helicase, partial [Pseudomonadota bacterium]
GGRRRHRGRPAPRAGRGGLAGWAGNWYLLAPPEPPGEALLALEDAKERARLLLERYGVACRELAEREGGPLRWSAVFRALRIMELGGEVLAGRFFHELSGPQFALPAAADALRRETPPPPVFWCNALDPVSPCGLGLDWPELPQRRPGNYLAFHHGALALVVEKAGAQLTFHLPPEHPDTAAVLAPLCRLLARRGRIPLERIDGAPPRDSAHLPALETLGRIVSDHRYTYLERATIQP